MQPQDLKRIRAVVDNGPFSDKEFILHADEEWDEDMDYLRSRQVLLRAYSSRLYEKIRVHMEGRKEDFYYQTCNELDALLRDPDFAKRTATFGAVVREAAFKAFIRVHEDICAYFKSCLSKPKLSSPTAP
jgi:hypothetical protein